MCEVAREWTRAHAFLVLMGGFALHDADKSFLRVLDEKTLEELDEAGEIEWPTITVKEIQDRSKADIFSKGIVLLQTTWFIIQCISRFATKLAVTELEVVTLAFAVLNAITYWLWWDKPSDVRCAVPVYLKSAEESKGKLTKVSKARRQRDRGISLSIEGRDLFGHRRNKHGLILAILYICLWVPIKVVFGPLWNMMAQEEIPDDDTARVPTFYSPLEKKEFFGNRPSFWTMSGVIVLFGAIHIIPWSFTFLTIAEKWLWRVSALLITGGPLLMLFPTIMFNWVSNRTLERIFNILSDFTFVILVPVYTISRVVLLILPLILLRSLPPTALRELKWSEFFPHI